MNESDKLDEMLILGTDSDIIGNLYNIEIDVEDSIVNYKGNNDFILSLRNWISSGKELTYRQKSAAEKVLKSTKIYKGSPCMYIELKDSDRVQTIINRMEHLNLKFNYHNNSILIWE
jgi:hypothetical protein